MRNVTAARFASHRNVTRIWNQQGIAERCRDMALGVRRSITDLQKDYDNGNKTALENLMRAWKGIKELPPDDPNSFFVIGGYHGEPFRGPGETDPNWWGGYCQPGTVLFPSGLAP